MCNLHHLVFRQGHVLASERKLKFEEASAIAEDIEDNAHIAIDAIIGALTDYAKTCGTALTVSNRDEIGPAKVRKSSTIQVDFPAFEFAYRGHRFETRTVVTVCVEDKQSKCWTRVSMRDDEADYPEAAADFEQLETLASQINAVVVEWYDGKIKSGVGQEFGVEVDFTMNVRTASGDDESFDDYFRRVYERAAGTEDEKMKAVSQEITRTLQIMNPNVDHSKIRGEVDGDKYRRFGVATERPTPISEVETDEYDGSDSESVNAIVSMKYNDNTAEFTGVGYDRFFNSNSSAFTLSSLASRSIAIEYGSLF